MSNQPPPRPWFRLATLARPQAPAQTQPPAAPVPRAPSFRPVFRPTVLTPQPPPASSAPSSQPQSPAPRAAILPPSSASPPRRSPPASPALKTPTTPPQSPLAIPPKATPPVTTSLLKKPQKSPSPPTPSPDASPPLQKSSPVVTKTVEHKRAPPIKAINNDGNGINPAYSLNVPPHSPNMKPSTTVSPPSPYALPPSVFNSSDELKNNYTPPEAEKKTVLVQETLPKLKPKPKGRESSQWKSADEEEAGMRFITITGENRGAVMELGYSPTKGRRTTNEGKEARSKMEEAAKAKGGLPMSAYMNSNVQGVNSSILFNSSCSHHDPGLHFSLSRKPFNNGAHSNAKNTPQNEKGNEKWFSA